MIIHENRSGHRHVEFWKNILFGMIPEPYSCYFRDIKDNS